MTKALTTLVFILCTSMLCQAQDSYHMNLQNELMNTYGLPQANWVLYDNEAQNLSSAFSYGSVTRSVDDAMNQAFSQKAILEVELMAGAQWTTGYGINSVQALAQGDHCLLVFWARADAEGRVSLSVQDAVTFQSEIYQTMPVTSDWKRYMFPFQASEDFPSGDLQFTFQLNWMMQTIEIGGMTVLNYEDRVNLDELPVILNNEFYEGHEPDAAWRSEAEERIEDLRKADLTVNVLGHNGSPLPSAVVEARMLEHDFGFGTAVAVQNFAGNSQQNDTYEARILDLDGEGHRFNEIVFENATKWRAWEDNWWGVNQDDKAKTVKWLHDRGFKIRGHTLIWPSWTNLPDDIFDNQNNTDYVLGRVLDHIESIMTYPGMEDGFIDWDVLNEISVLNDLANTMQGATGYPTGREVYLDILDKFYELDPDGVAYINDYTTFGSGSSLQAKEDLKTYLGEIVDSGRSIDGIGFQGHIGAYPTGISELQSILDDFYTSFGTDAKITEFDMKPLLGDDLAAKYLEDFYTLCFSHPSMTSILMWGFWDGAHWFDNAPMFDEDWNLKPAGEAFLNLVFDKWWTEEDGMTDQDGNYSLRGFKGQYEVTVTCEGQTWTDTLSLTSDTLLTVDCSLVSSSDHEPTEVVIDVYPNPSEGQLTIQWMDHRSADVSLFDSNGRKIISLPSVNGTVHIREKLPAGIYQLRVAFDDQTLSRRVVIQ